MTINDSFLGEGIHDSGEYMRGADEVGGRGYMIFGLHDVQCYRMRGGGSWSN